MFVAQWFKGAGFVIRSVPGSNLLPCNGMDLCVVIPDLTPSRFVNSLLASLQPVGIFNKFLFNLQNLFAHFSVISYYSSAKDSDT